MVKKVDSYMCDICGKTYDIELWATNCENLHKEGLIVKEYLHGDGTLSEIKEHHEDRGNFITDTQTKMIQSLLYEVEIDIKLMDGSAEIIGIKKESVTKDDLR